MKENVKSPDFNPFPMLLILFCFALLMWCFSEKASAAERQAFCTEEQIQNFEDSGQYDDSDDFYILSDNVVYNIYSWYDDQIYYNSNDYEFTVNNNEMVIGYIKDGQRYIQGYSKKLSMYDYKDACILRINDKTDIIVENELDSFLTNNGIEIKNEYSLCEFDKEYLSVPCHLIVMNNNLVSNLLATNNLFILVFSVFAIGVAILLFIKVREVF